MNKSSKNLKFIYKHSHNLYYLALTPEFEDVESRIDLLKNKSSLTSKDIDYIANVRKHLENIDPHYETMTINGEQVEVFCITKSIMRVS